MPERRPRIPEDLAGWVDKTRGDVPFERWVRRAVEQKLARDLTPELRHEARTVLEDALAGHGTRPPVAVSSPVVEPTGSEPPSAAERPTPEQIHGRCGVPMSTARMWWATGEWERHW